MKVTGRPLEVPATTRAPAAAAQVKIFAMEGRTILRAVPAEWSNERRPPVTLPYTINWMVVAMLPILSSALRIFSGRKSGITDGNTHGGEAQKGQDTGGSWDTHGGKAQKGQDTANGGGWDTQGAKGQNGQDTDGGGWDTKKKKKCKRDDDDDDDGQN